MIKFVHKLAGLAAVLAGVCGICQIADAGGREEGRLLTAAQVLEEIENMPDQRVPDYLLQRAYGIAVIPDVDKVAFLFGGRRGKGALVVRDNLGAAWSNPALITLTGGSFGFQAGAQSSDILLVFTTKAGIEGIAGGKLTLGADASVATGPVGRQGSAATDMAFNAEIYSYARTRGLFGGIAIDGSVITIDRSANASLYGKDGVTATEIFSAAPPPAPPAAQRFMEQMARVTRASAQASAAATGPAAAPTTTAPAPGAPEPARTYPLETQPMTTEPEPKQR